MGSAVGATLDQHPETQLHDLRAMAQQRGFQIVHEYTDRISGTKARRPGLDELLHDARRGRFQAVLVWASDRIARSVRHFLEVLDELNHLGVEFVSFRENLDTGCPLGRAAVIIIGATADGSISTSWPVRCPFSRDLSPGESERRRQRHREIRCLWIRI
jgi:DNA invertase Pin-like site-specific DNA recombinase